MLGTEQHSPLPWTTAVDGHSSEICDANGEFVTDVGMDGALGMLSEVETEVANRDFIVRACNSHYDLLAALEAMWEAFVPYSGTSPEQEEAIGLARAAIANARGK